MPNVSYKMTKAMYNSIKYPVYWSEKEKKMVRTKKHLSDKEVLDYVNSSFGIIGNITEIVFC